MSTVKTRKPRVAKPKEAVPQLEPLAKAHSAIHVDSQALLYTHQAEMQKFPSVLKFEALYAAYQHNSWVMRGVNVVASSVCANGYKVVPIDRTEQPDDKATDLLTKFLSQCNEKDSFNDIINRIVIETHVVGNSYLEVIRLSASAAKSSLRKAFKPVTDRFAKDSELSILIDDSIDESLQELDGLPIAMYTIDPRTVAVLTDKHGTVIGYDQVIMTGERVHFDANSVMHFKYTGGIDNAVMGVSPLISLELDLIVDLMRQVYLKSQLTNASKLGYIFNLEDSQSDTVSRFQEYLNMRTRGAVNAAENVVVEGKMNVTAPPAAAYDAAESLGDNLRDRILCCLGVPPAKLGIMESGSLNSSTEEGNNKSFIEITVKNCARSIERSFNMFLVPDFKAVGVNGVGIQICTEDIDLFQTRATTVIALRNAGILTVNESRIELQLVPYPAVGDMPTMATSSGVVSVKSTEASVNAITAIHSKLDGIAGSLANKPNPDNSKNPGAKSPTVSDDKTIQKELKSLATDLKRFLKSSE